MPISNKCKLTLKALCNMFNIMVSKWQNKWRSSIQSAKARPGADCGSDHELLIAKYRLKLKKVGKR